MARLRVTLILALAVSLAASSGHGDSSEPLPRPELTSASPEAQQRAREAWRLASESPSDSEAVGRLGLIFQAYDQHGQALECFKRAVGISPGSRWEYHRGVVLTEMGRDPEAAEAFRAVLRADPGNGAARLRLADALRKTGELEESYELYARHTEAHPQEMAAHLGMGRVRAQQGRHQEALEHFQRAAAFARDYGPLHYALGLTYQRLGDADAAQRHLALYEKLGPTRQAPFADPWMDEVEQVRGGSYLHHLNNGLRLEAAGKLEQALEEYNRAIEADPNRATPHVNLISLYSKLGDPARAEEHYRRAMELNPNSEEAHYNLAVLKTVQSEFAEAEKYYRKTLELNPFSADAHNNLGYVVEQQGRGEEAERHFRLALEHSPNFRLAHFHLGLRLLSRGETAKAIGHLEQTLDPLDEKSPQFFYALAKAYQAAGKWEQAKEAAQRARALAEQFGRQDILQLLERDAAGG